MSYDELGQPRVGLLVPEIGVEWQLVLGIAFTNTYLLTPLKEGVGLLFVHGLHDIQVSLNRFLVETSPGANCQRTC